MKIQMNVALVVAVGCALYSLTNTAQAQEANQDSQPKADFVEQSEIVLDIAPVVVEGQWLSLDVQPRIEKMDGSIEALDAAIQELQTRLAAMMRLRSDMEKELGQSSQHVSEIDANLNQLEVKLTELHNKKASLEGGRVGLMISSALAQLNEALAIVEASEAAKDEKIRSWVGEWRVLADQVKSDQDDFVLYWQALAEAPKDFGKTVMGHRVHLADVRQAAIEELLKQKQQTHQHLHLDADHALHLAHQSLELQKAEHLDLLKQNEHLQLLRQHELQKASSVQDVQQSAPLNERLGELENRLDRIEKLLEKALGDKAEQ